jgi:tyrosyl-tRNA synthetase
LEAGTVSMNVYEEFQWRGIVYDATEGVPEVLARETVTAYIGFDPTASSLHIGSLLPLMALGRLQRFGHVPIAIAGGGTGTIGDPSGKAQERTLLSLEEIERNLDGIRPQLARFLDFDASPNAARIVNNADWLAGLDLLGFLRDTGKYFTVNYMLQKESVSRRLESEEGISFTEFSYLMLQARDFLELFDRHGCTMQLGGSDQWGNITAGIDLIRKVRGKKAHGLVMPLVTTASGAKFGKTEAGTVWLDPERTSPFRFYQFWLNTDDRDVVKYLKFFTLLERPAIAELEAVVAAAAERREAQRVLAREVTRLVHGDEALGRAEHASAVLFGQGLADAPIEAVLMAFDDVPSVEIEASELEAGMRVTQLAVRAGLAASGSQATQLVRGGGLYLNDVRVTDERQRVTAEDALKGWLLYLRKGQRERRLVKIARR